MVKGEKKLNFFNNYIFQPDGENYLINQNQIYVA